MKIHSVMSYLPLRYLVFWNHLTYHLGYSHSTSLFTALLHSWKHYLQGGQGLTQGWPSNITQHCWWTNSVDTLASLMLPYREKLLHFESWRVPWHHFTSLLVQKPVLCLPHAKTEVSPSPTHHKGRRPEKKPRYTPKSWLRRERGSTAPPER